MGKVFVEAKNRKELRTMINESDYTVIKKVCGGYMCFEYASDYDVWKGQK